MKRIIFACLLGLSFTASTAQTLQSPAEFLGYELGDHFTRHHRIVEYFQYVANTKSNVTLQQYGETNERRPLVVTMLSSQKNMDRLDEIRTNNLKRTGLVSGTPGSDDIAIVWLSYNVHGNEASSSEATMQTLWELASSDNAATQKWLENTVVIIDPCINPDGRDRYANFYNQFGDKTPNPNLDSKEHNEIWPGGRYNHYMYDLNRDWAWQTQIESEARLELYNQWMPHIHVDFHEQGINNPYYFAPAAEPYHKGVTNWQREFQDLIGENHAKYFDDQGWAYFTKEVFDLLYPSYGDTYPMNNGAIGMTYEQAGGGGGGLAADLANGDTLRLSDRIAHHTTTSLSTVEVASTNSARLINEFEQFFQNPGQHPGVNYKTFVISKTNNADKVAALQSLLKKNDISFGIASSAGKKLTGYNYQSNRTGSIPVQAGDMLVTVNQPKGALASALFEPSTFIADSMTYDITAWSMPFAYGLEAYATKSALVVTTEVKPAATAESARLSKPYALILPYGSFEDLKTLSTLLSSGVKVRSASSGFTIEGQSFNPGTLLVLRADNKHLPNYVDIVRKTATEHNRKLVEAKSGLVNQGKDFGSRSMQLLDAPKVAVISGEGVSATGFGTLWYYFEQELNYPVTILDTDYVNYVDLAEYDILILPNGNYRSLGDDELDQIKTWTSDGGRLILIAGALRKVVDKEGFNLKSKYEEEEPKEKEEPSQKRFEDRRRESLTNFIPGAIYKVTLDNSHPLAYGYPSSYFTLKQSSSKYVLLNDGWNVGVLESSTPIAGFAGYKTIKTLQNTLVLGSQSKGSGDIIYFVDDPIFRSFWYNGKLMLGNAVFMSGI